MAEATIYNTAEWQRARKLALERDGHRCTAVEGYDVVIDIDPDGYVEGVEVPVRCEADACLDVHHITPIRVGGAPFDLDNLMTLCPEHHLAMHAILREHPEDLPMTREQEMLEDLLDAVRQTTLGEGLETELVAA